MRSVALSGIFFVLVATACQREYHTKSVQVREGPNAVSLAGVHLGNKFVYAFAWPTDIPKVDTNHPETTPRPTGIHFLYTAPDGLWFNGAKVVFPKESPVFALRRDGQVIPIELNDAELREVSELSRTQNKTAEVPQGALRQKLLEPFGSGESS